MAARGARAQAKLPTIGYFGSGTPATQGQWAAAFVQRLRELGWIDARNVAIEYRWAEGRPERFAEIAAEFVRLKVDVIVTSATPPALAAKQATSVIPIVFATVGDPVGTDLVASLARPGGNVTGLSNQTGDLAAKRVELLREVIPRLGRLAILTNISNPAAVLEMREAQAAASALGLTVDAAEIRRAEDITPALRGAQGPRGCTLCSSRRACEHLPHSHQYLGARCETADDAWLSGVRRIGRSDVLWSKLPGLVPASRRLCGQDSTRRETERPPCRAADQIRPRPPKHSGSTFRRRCSGAPTR